MPMPEVKKTAAPLVNSFPDPNGEEPMEGMDRSIQKGTSWWLALSTQ
jgi:hypothetical protein